MTEHIDLDRKFWPVEADKENDPESIQVMFAYGLGQQFSWEELLGKYSTVILAEPGTGKTEEFQAVTKRLRIDGKPAFFCRIELLQNLDKWKNGITDGRLSEIDTKLEQWYQEKKHALFKKYWFYNDQITTCYVFIGLSFSILIITAMIYVVRRFWQAEN